MPDLNKNLPQTKTLLPALLILLSGGMNIAWSLGFYTGKVVTEHLMYCWFIGGLIGALAVVFFVKKLSVKWLLLLPSVIITIGGVIYVSAANNEVAIGAARYLNGFAFTWTFVVSLTVSGEQVVKSLRGRFISLEAVSINFGIFAQITYSFNEPDNAPYVHASVIIVFGIMSSFLSLTSTIESPLYFLERNDENSALTCLMRLQKPHAVTPETHELLAEYQHYIAEQRNKTQMEAIVEGVTAYVKVSLHRCFIAMSFALPLNLALIAATMMGPQKMWPLTFYSLMRFIGSIIFSFLTEKVGRKKPILLSLPLCAGMLLGAGILFNSTVDEKNAMSVIVLMLIYQLFAGIYSGASEPQICEAFPLQVKHLFMSAVSITEMLLQILIIVASFRAVIIDLPAYCFTLAALTVGYMIYVYFCLPETKETTLREAQAKYKELINSGFN